MTITLSSCSELVMQRTRHAANSSCSKRLRRVGTPWPLGQPTSGRQSVRVWQGDPDKSACAPFSLPHALPHAPPRPPPPHARPPDTTRNPADATLPLRRCGRHRLTVAAEAAPGLPLPSARAALSPNIANRQRPLAPQPCCRPRSARPATQRAPSPQSLRALCNDAFTAPLAYTAARAQRGPLQSLPCYRLTPQPSLRATTHSTHPDICTSRNPVSVSLFCGSSIHLIL